MEVKLVKEAKNCIIQVIGRLDTNTAPELETKIKECLDGTELLTFDFANLEYLSSAGLRVLLASFKKISSFGGNMKIVNVNETVKEIFTITGMSNIFNIE